MRSLNSILKRLGIKTKSNPLVYRYKCSNKVLTLKSIFHILTAFCSLLIVFTPLSAQAANYLAGTAYNQNNTGTSAGGSFSGSVLQTYNFTTIDLTNVNPAGQGDNYSFVIEGFIYASVDGTYDFETYTDDGIRVIVDGTLIINNWTDHGPTINTGDINLLTGWIPVRIEHYEKGGGQVLRFRWKPPNESSFSFPTAADLSNEDLPDRTNSNTTLVASPTSVVANGSTTSSVTVRLADANGNLLSASGGTVALSSTGSATISAVTDNTDGTYTATVTNTVAENVTISGTLDGAAITDTATITFTDINAPILVSSTPLDNASRVELDQNITLNFSEDVIAGSGNINLFEENGFLVESFKVSSSIISGSTVTLNPTADFKHNSIYYVQIPVTAFEDTAGNTYAGITNDKALNFSTRQKTPKEKFTEVKSDIKTSLESNTTKQINFFRQTTKTVISSARDRYISNRVIKLRSNLGKQYSEGFAPTRVATSNTRTSSDKPVSMSLASRDSTSSFDLRASTRGILTNGQTNGILQSSDGKTTRLTGTKFNYTRSKDTAEAGSATSQVIFERENSDDLTIGHFIGFSFSKYSQIGQSATSTDATIKTLGLQFGGYFIHNITEDFFIDGYVAGSLLLNQMKVATNSFNAESDFSNKMGSIGLAATGSIPLDRSEIRPTLALDYSAVSSQEANFEVTSGTRNSNEIIVPINERQKSFTFSSDFRRYFEYSGGYLLQSPIVSLKPKVTCRLNYQEKIFNECGQGATLSITTQPEESMTKVYFLIGVDKISDSITYSTNAFYKVEF